MIIGRWLDGWPAVRRHGIPARSFAAPASRLPGHASIGGRLVASLASAADDTHAFSFRFAAERRRYRRTSLWHAMAY